MYVFLVECQVLERTGLKYLGQIVLVTDRHACNGRAGKNFSPRVRQFS